MSSSYHDTVGVTAKERETHETSARTQERIIADHYRKHPNLSFGPSQIQGLLPHAPITSIRRAITNLTNRGLLVKLDDTVPGLFRTHREHLWQWNVSQLPLFAMTSPAEVVRGSSNLDHAAGAGLP